MTLSLDRRSFIAAATSTLVAAAAPAAGFPRIERRSPLLDALLPDAPIETIATGLRWAEGPVWARDRLFFSDPAAGTTHSWSRGEGVRTIATAATPPGTDPARVREGGTNGLALHPDGRLLAAHSGLRAIVALDPATGRSTILADRFEGKRFNSPNDLLVAPDGAIWFTDPPYGLADGDASPLKEQLANAVYRLAPDGRVARIVSDLSRPNGLALSPDGRRLYVAVSDDAFPRVLAYDLSRRHQAGRARMIFDGRPLKAAGGPGLCDGMKATPRALFCSAPGGVVILSPAGLPLGRIVHDAPIANLSFGPDALYLAANDRILRVPARPEVLTP